MEKKTNLERKLIDYVFPLQINYSYERQAGRHRAISNVFAELHRICIMANAATKQGKHAI